MFKFNKNKKDKVQEILDKEVEYREKNDNHNMVSSKHRVLKEIENLVDEQENKKKKIGRHEYVLMGLIAYLAIFPLFFLSFLIPLGLFLVFLFLYYRADKKSKEYQYEHKFWNRMFDNDMGIEKARYGKD